MDEWLGGDFQVRPIGVIHSAFTEAVGTPIQPTYAQEAAGQVVIAEPYADALDDIEGFERLWLIYWMDRVGGFQARVTPYRDTRAHGLFATRAPCRPNPIGLSAVRLVRREGRILHVADVDILDGTPLLDIKPYVPEFDAQPRSRAGWLEESGEGRRLADARFHDGLNRPPRGQASAPPSPVPGGTPPTLGGDRP
jgi:tRNA-Thr(GGU) m(6)t(6)A37 methyltransferase TsaA